MLALGKTPESKWSVDLVLSDMRMLKDPVKPENQKKFGFKVGRKFFYRSDKKYNLSWGMGPAWIKLGPGKKWPTKYVDKGKLSCSSIVTEEILSTHIRESLIHEILKVLFVSKGWYMNYEMPVKYKEKGKKRKGRIDFLIKRSGDDPWQVIEVKLADEPYAVEQLAKYVSGIKDEVRKVKDCNDSSFCLLAGSRKGTVKELEKIILCPKEAKDETEREGTNPPSGKLSRD